VTARTTKPVLISIIEASKYRGCILSRGKLGFESFDVAERSLGVHADSKLAAEAVLRSRAA